MNVTTRFSTWRSRRISYVLCESWSPGQNFRLPKTSVSSGESMCMQPFSCMGFARWNHAPNVQCCPVPDKAIFFIMAYYRKIVMVTVFFSSGCAALYLIPSYFSFRFPRSFCLNLKPTLQRSFSYAAPAVWNTLPHKIRSSNTLSSFRSAFQTDLFQQSY